MASEAVNGMDYNQYSQPAELAASTPSHQASASQGSNGASSQQQKADPQEIGWYFVEQYYTTLSKSPDKIHLFYNKKSQLITGTEAEKVLPAVGSKAISEKIKSLDISDCKIRVLNVDSQSSYDNIVVQVIGEMSNKNQPHHKFVQTFILATQPNGYFVLNDIFRYLNEDVDEIVEDEPVTEEATTQPEEATGEVEPVPTPAANEVVDNEEAAEQVDKELETAIEQSEGTAEEVNGTAAPVEETTETEPEAEVDTSVEPESEPAVEETATLEEEKPLDPEPTPTETSATTSTTAQPIPAADAAPVKKTWASLVGSSKAPVVPAVPQTQAPAAAPSQPKPRPVSTAQATKAPAEPTTETTASTPTSQSNGWQEAGKKTKQQAKTQEGIVHAYIKNVNDKIDARVLREVLEKFGKLKYYDVSRPKQCAFVEFEDSASYAAAVAENPHQVGTETINVEERRPRPGTTGTNFTRGGAQAGRGRGGQQQRSGSQGAGYTRDAAPRGNFQGSRGNKTAGPARGRGQAQAA
ncbi:hypothetical protein LTR64_005055 [Lithohypha guttulata]|uniref:uncharacterized protein n=1 Tax=Lithohypha guttulata TaxID=1690604 RepID=UPI002DDDFB54|nr:hypothetical protein LTR51_005110 [Lithohypha guttulata]